MSTQGSRLACAVAHHSPLPTPSTAMHLSPPHRLQFGGPMSTSGQSPTTRYVQRWPSVDRLLTPRQACPREGPSGATCVQRLDGSRDSAIHTTYRISLRSSSMREPRYPLPRVILFLWPMQHRHNVVCLSKSVFLGDIPRRIPVHDQRVEPGCVEEELPPR